MIAKGSCGKHFCRGSETVSFSLLSLRVCLSACVPLFYHSSRVLPPHVCIAFLDPFN